MLKTVLAQGAAALNALIWALLCLDQATALYQLSEMRSLTFERDFIAIGIYTAGLAIAVVIAVAVFLFRKPGPAIFSCAMCFLAIFLLIVENASVAG